MVAVNTTKLMILFSLLLQLDSNLLLFASSVDTCTREGGTWRVSRADCGEGRHVGHVEDTDEMIWGRHVGHVEVSDDQSVSGQQEVLLFQQSMSLKGGTAVFFLRF